MVKSLGRQVDTHQFWKTYNELTGASSERSHARTHARTHARARQPNQRVVSMARCARGSLSRRPPAVRSAPHGRAMSPRAGGHELRLEAFVSLMHQVTADLRRRYGTVGSFGFVDWCVRWCG
eukprot:COSAG01_NODE_96_length_26789_cov_36.697089_25_plen_122_part_00